MPKARQVQVPGETAATPAEAVAAVAGDDLADYDGDKLPDANAPTPAQLQAQILALEAKLARKAQAEAKAGAKVAPEVLSVEAAQAKLKAMVKSGLRPRAILTPEGWLTHPEMARVAEHGKD